MKKSMKKVAAILLGGLLLTNTSVYSVCASETLELSVEKKSSMDSITTSYYEGQSSRAYRMLQKSIFKKLLKQWTPVSVINPTYDYETFAQYYINGSTRQDLFICTFSSENNKHGYVVVSYDGDSLSRIAVEITPYLYDLRSNLETISNSLSKTELDLSSTKASREQMDGMEIIHFIDKNKNEYVCNLATFDIVKV